jgi:hypothetical protein
MTTLFSGSSSQITCESVLSVPVSKPFDTHVTTVSRPMRPLMDAQNARMRSIGYELAVDRGDFVPE